MSEVERILRAVLKHGGTLQAVFSIEGEAQAWNLTGIEEDSPRIEFTHKDTHDHRTMDAKALEELSMDTGGGVEVFYHRTTEEAWLKIQQEGILWGGK